MSWLGREALILVRGACRQITASCGPLPLSGWWFPLQRPSCGARGQHTPHPARRWSASVSPQVSLAGDTRTFFSPWPCEGDSPSFSSDAVTEQGPFLSWSLALEETPHHIQCHSQPPSGLGAGRSI